MDHRDRGRGELARHERQTSDDWDNPADPATPWPGDPYSRPDGTYRTPSRRRARHRGAPEPVDSYTPSWAREPGQAGAPWTSADTAIRGSDPVAAPGDGGRHHRVESAPDPPSQPSNQPRRRRVAPEVSWDSTGEYWRRPGSAGHESTGEDPAVDSWRGTGGWQPDTNTGAGVTGRHGVRRAEVDRREGDDDAGGWAAAPTSGWAAAAPTTGAPVADAPISGGWIADAPTSGGWAAAAPTTGSPGGHGLAADRSGMPAPGRRRWSDPAEGSSAVPASGWGVDAAPSQSGVDDRDRPELTDPRNTGSPSWAEEPGQGWRKPAGEPVGGDRERPGSRRPGRSGSAQATPRWVRSPGEVDPGDGAGRRSRGTERQPGRADIGGRRRERKPDSEPVRRDQDAGPVRRLGDDWGTRGRHADPGPEYRADATRAERRADPGPWDRLTDTGMLDRVTDADPPGGPGAGRRRDRSTDTGQWDRATDTGQWDRFTDTTEWRHGELAGLASDNGKGRDGTGNRDGEPDDARGAGPGRVDTFWSGTRLAGDDPRWMGIPDSAPRSPAVAYSPATPIRRPSGAAPATRRRAEPAQARDRAGTAGTPRNVGGPGSRTGWRAPPGRPLSASAARRQAGPLSRRLEDDLLDPRPSGPLTAVLYTAAWYAVAVLAVFVWVLTLDASVPGDCLPGLPGGCESERGQAMTALLNGVPRFAAAVATGLVVAALMRWVNRTWRAVTVGFAAAVVGGGLSTVLFSVISGQPLG